MSLYIRSWELYWGGKTNYMHEQLCMKSTLITHKSFGCRERWFLRVWVSKWHPDDCWLRLWLKVFLTCVDQRLWLCRVALMIRLSCHCVRIQLLRYLLYAQWTSRNTSTLTLALVVANLTNTKWCKKPEKWLKPWHMGTHLTELSKSCQMNTNMPGFRWFSKIFASLCFGR